MSKNTDPGANTDPGVNTDPPTAGGGESGEQAHGIEQLKDVVRQVVSEMLPKSGRKSADDGPDVEAQVRKAIADAKERDARTAAERAKDERIKALEDKVAGRETAPRQHRKIEKFFGWVREDDQR